VTSGQLGCRNTGPCACRVGGPCHDRTVTTALIYLIVMMLVAGAVFLIASLVFGRGEELAPLPPGASPTRLPAADVAGEDVRAVRFQPVLRGYKMSEVDWVLGRVAGELDSLRAKLAELETASVSAGDAGPAADTRPGAADGAGE